jgi:hypothetical protein
MLALELMVDSAAPKSHMPAAAASKITLTYSNSSWLKALCWTVKRKIIR